MRTSYQRQIQRIEDRKALLSSTRVSWQADQATLIKWQTNHEEAVKRIMQERESSALWRSSVTHDVEVLTATRDMIISTRAASQPPLSPSSSSLSSSSSSSSTASSCASSEMMLFLAAREQLDVVQESFSALLISQARSWLLSYPSCPRHPYPSIPSYPSSLCFPNPLSCFLALPNVHVLSNGYRPLHRPVHFI